MRRAPAAGKPSIQYAESTPFGNGHYYRKLGTDRSAGKELVSTGIYLATGGHRNGSAGCGLYSAYFASATVARHRLEDAIDDSKDNVHYRPIVSLSSGRKLSVPKLLARWQQADGTFLSPGNFYRWLNKPGSRALPVIIDTVFEDMGSWLKSIEQHISISLEASIWRRKRCRLLSTRC